MIPHRGAYEPLQLVGYLAVTVLIIFMCTTGLALFAADDHEGFAALISPMNDRGIVLGQLWYAIQNDGSVNGDRGAE